MRAFWISAGLLFLAGCGSAPPAASYVHIVLYKIDSPAPEKVADRVLEDAREKLLPITVLSDFWVGRPVAKASTDEYTVDADYDVGMVFTFPSEKELRAFQDHPDFREFQKLHAQELKARVLDFSPYVEPPVPPAP